MSLADLPLVTPDLPGTGGQIKVEPEHFVVAEVPLYEPVGEGDHLFICVTRSGRTTQQVVGDLAAELKVAPRDIGYAGLKDRQALATQVLSLPYITSDQAQTAADAVGLELHWAIPHNKKLKMGHLLGNRFTITVLDPSAEDPVGCARDVVEALQRRGLPNYFGAQRFGAFGANAERGLAILTGKERRPGSRWLFELLISAYQAQLFNAYLALRIRRGGFDHLLAGDLAKKTDTGGMFVVEDVEVEQPRFERKEITFTGPLFGYEMWSPVREAALLEAEVLAGSPVQPQEWRRHHVAGTRRAGKLFLDAVEVLPHADGYVISFFLPKGAYATTLLREVLKVEPAPAADDTSPEA